MRQAGSFIHTAIIFAEVMIKRGSIENRITADLDTDDEATSK